MSLWYETGNGEYTVSFARKKNNCAAFVCCGGPSLSYINPKYLNGHNRIVFGLNNTYPFVYPDVWIGMDDPACYSRDIFWQPFTKIMRGGYQDRTCESKKINDLHNVYYADLETVEDPEEIFKRRDHDVKFVWGKNTFITALHFVLWMGCREIYLFGCDLDNSNKNYFNEVTLEDSHRDYNQRLYNQLFDYLKWFVDTGKKHGIKVRSCSNFSKINSFIPYVDYLDVIKEKEKDLEYGKKLTHSMEAG
tara:strand:- start:5941 stop:6684 length:744 start_codon:yes stop_codon:yes gene_type:complete